MEGVKTYSFHCKKFFHLDVLTIIYYLCSLANACMCNFLTVIFDILFLKVTYLLSAITLECGWGMGWWDVWEPSRDVSWTDVG